MSGANLEAVAHALRAAAAGIEAGDGEGITDAAEWVMKESQEKTRLAVCCGAGHEHVLKEYGSDNGATHYKGACPTAGFYFEIHVWPLSEVEAENPSWLDGTEAALPPEVGGTGSAAGVSDHVAQEEEPEEAPRD